MATRNSTKISAMPGTVVSNSSPLIHLARIGKLGLLHELFGEVSIPPAVYEECVVEGKGRPEVVSIKNATWLRVAQVTDQNLVKLLYSEIDRGEAEAIALALESDAALILLDDADAREKARLYDLTITGVIGVLLRAKKAGRISILSEALVALVETGFWINHTLRNRVLAEAGEIEDDQ